MCAHLSACVSDCFVAHKISVQFAVQRNKAFLNRIPTTPLPVHYDTSRAIDEQEGSEINEVTVTRIILRQSARGGGNGFRG